MSVSSLSHLDKFHHGASVKPLSPQLRHQMMEPGKGWLCLIFIVAASKTSSKNITGSKVTNPPSIAVDRVEREGSRVDCPPFSAFMRFSWLSKRRKSPISKRFHAPIRSGSWWRLLPESLKETAFPPVSVWYPCFNGFCWPFQRVWSIPGLCCI